MARPPTASRDGAGLGTTTRVVVTDPAALAPTAALLDAMVLRLDAAASRFRPDSELSAANRAAGTPVMVGPTLRDVLAACLAMAEATGGLVDPTVGDLVARAGYDRTYAALPARSGTLRPDPRPRPDWRDVVLRPTTAGAALTVPPGCSLDVGAVGKAWLADQVAAAAARRLGCGVLVDLGGDIAVAGPSPDGGWIVATPGGTGSVAMDGGGVATSATDRRRWATADGPAHHLVDPRTGLPAVSPWRTATVFAADGATANAAATAAVVLGEAAPDWLRAHRLPALLVPVDPRRPAVEVRP